MNDRDVTLGELYRLQLAMNAELHDFRAGFETESDGLRTKIEANSLGIGILSQRMTTAEGRVADVETDVKDISRRSAMLSGAIALAGFLAQLFNPWHR